jgi:1,4-alpha-glucan branching enzyme
LLAPEDGRTGYDAIWCDCLMHSIYAQGVRDLQLSHRKYDGGGELAEALGDGYLYVFEDRKPQRITAEQRAILRREEDERTAIASFVTALQTHDGVGNHPHGKRIHHLTSTEFQRSAAALTLLYPSIPLIFMGEEVSSDAKFPFFADFEDIALRRAVDHGRAREYPQHAWRDALPPSDPRAFYEAKCHDPGQGDADTLAWYRKLIEFRKSGIAAGWLSAANMSSAFDSARDLFSLRYTIDRDLAIVVLARLTAGDRHEADPVPVPLEGDLILSSISAPDATGANILLHPNHAVVVAGGGLARPDGFET